ncbi:hypothetical protein C2E23DRAFT_742997 [Lenzites betulinus]|nr:hypothetical protein C2E23DRAFT_742997 [Lenzites betulinus]
MVETAHQAPIARLPVELLSYIFILGAHTPDVPDEEDGGMEGYDEGGHEVARPDERGDISPCVSSSSTPPDVFAAVNRHWREVALGTPQLWTRVVVTIGDLIYGGDSLFPAMSRYLSRSAKCSLDVYIDARDPEWDFSETDSMGAVINFPYIEESHDYTHPFSVEHMHCVFDLLLPHIARTRSLAILTDRWAPMETALERLSFEKPDFASRSRTLPPNLPLLESLVLMRCNEFVSYNPRFTPLERKDAAYLPFRGLLNARDRTQAQAPLLPRIRHLTLSGVHLDWFSLPSILPPSLSSSGSGLQHLALSYHSPDVRPTEMEFREIMRACPKLESLTVRVSGLRVPETPSACSFRPTALPIALPRLTMLDLGYDDVYAATMLLGVIDASAITEVILEDASSPSREDSLDAEPLLRACSSEPRRHPGPDQPLFPRAESVTLRRVEASAEAFESFFHALPHLRRLDIAQMFLLGAGALANRNVELAFTPPDMPTPALDDGVSPAEHDQSRAKSVSDRPCHSSGPPTRGIGTVGGERYVY